MCSWLMKKIYSFIFWQNYYEIITIMKDIISIHLYILRANVERVIKPDVIIVGFAQTWKTLVTARVFSHFCLGYSMKVTMSKTPASKLSMPKIQPHFNMRTLSVCQSTIIMQKWFKIVASAVSEKKTFNVFSSTLSFPISKYGPRNSRYTIFFLTHLKLHLFYHNLVHTSFRTTITLINMLMLWQLGSEHHGQEQSFNNSACFLFTICRIVAKC